MHNILKFILFWNNTLHVFGGLSVHHQEFKTVHTASGRPICHTGSVTACQNKINLRYCVSGWFYYRNILRCTVLQMSNLLNLMTSSHLIPVPKEAFPSSLPILCSSTVR